MNLKKPSLPSTPVPGCQPSADLSAVSSVTWIDPLLHGLAKRYPSMFNGRNLGLNMCAGWLPVFDGLCADIHQALREASHQFRWSQTKEKFGSARWYWTLGSKTDRALDFLCVFRNYNPDFGIDPLRERRDVVTQLVLAAQEKTRTMCMVCGQAASTKEREGWYVVSCEAHFQLLMRQPEQFIHLCSTGMKT